MSDAGEDFEQTRTVTEAIDRASQSVRAACDLLTDAVDRLRPLLPDCEGPEAANAVASYTAARDVLLTQLDTMDRAKKAIGV